MTPRFSLPTIAPDLYQAPARTGERGQVRRARQEPDKPRLRPGLADQRLRVLHRHAHQALTTLATAHPSDEVFDEARVHFDDKEVAILVWAAATINTWNRVTVAARTEVGGYQPPGR